MIWSQLSHIQRMKLQIELVIQFLRFAMGVSYMTNPFCIHSAHMSHIYIYIYICGRLFRFAKIKIWEQCEEAKKSGFPQTKCEFSHLGVFLTETFAGPFFSSCALATLFML